MHRHKRQLEVESSPIFLAIADRNSDSTFAAWLPNPLKTYVEKFDRQFKDIGVNMEGVKHGLAVPTYMERIDSIEDVKSN